MALKVLDRKNKRAHGKDIIHVNKSSGEINFSCGKITYRDRDTRQVVVFLPSLDITGYGATEKKAMQMVNSSVVDFFDYLIQLPAKKIDAELSKLGWKKNHIKHKEFSKAYVGVDGKLKDFNAVGDEIEEGVLTF